MFKRIIINIFLLAVFLAIMTAISLPFSAETQFNAGERFVSGGQWEKAEEAYAGAVMTAPFSSEYWIGYGDFLWDVASQEDIDSAWEDVEPAYAWAAALNPECAQCWVKLGQIQRADGKIEEAAASFEKALERDPNGTDTAYWVEQYKLETQNSK